MKTLTIAKNKLSLLLMFAALAVVAAMPTLMTSLDLSTLMDTDKIFEYANLLLIALGPVVLIGIGFALAKYIITFVQRVFNSL